MLPENYNTTVVNPIQPVSLSERPKEEEGEEEEEEEEGDKKGGKKTNLYRKQTKQQKKKKHTSCIQNEWRQEMKRGRGIGGEGFTVFSATTQRRMRVCVQGREC